MAENSHIEWTHHTFNPWWGCSWVSEACDHCYAEKEAHRRNRGEWGHNTLRWFNSSAYWLDPLKWDAAAAAEFRRARVFCASMSDVFEEHPDPRLDQCRAKLWKLIADTPNLDWLLLTKRPQNVKRMTRDTWGDNWPENVWLGISVENQKWADKRIPVLLSCPAKVRFLSCEPLIGPVDLSKWVKKGEPSPIHWVIVGGESGFKSQCRAMDPEWVRALREFTLAHNIGYHFKQWGCWVPNKT